MLLSGHSTMEIHGLIGTENFAWLWVFVGFRTQPADLCDNDSEFLNHVEEGLPSPQRIDDSPWTRRHKSVWCELVRWFCFGLGIIYFFMYDIYIYDIYICIYRDICIYDITMVYRSLCCLGGILYIYMLYMTYVYMLYMIYMISKWYAWSLCCLWGILTISVIYDICLYVIYYIYDIYMIYMISTWYTWSLCCLSGMWYIYIYVINMIYMKSTWYAWSLRCLWGILTIHVIYDICLYVIYDIYIYIRGALPVFDLCWPWGWFLRQLNCMDAFGSTATIIDHPPGCLRFFVMV